MTVMSTAHVHQIQALLAHDISGVVDGVVTTSREASGAVAFHLVVGPPDRPRECDRIEFTLDPEHARALFSDPADRPALVPCRVGVAFNSMA
ncbi:hypothetical protein [Streptomyces sp. NPDC059072]|uniref:hypothetical protein n=1 Tax=unclassified Streptomyces TaxID=2593676 RepID=UPI0036C865A8